MYKIGSHHADVLKAQPAEIPQVTQRRDRNRDLYEDQLKARLHEITMFVENLDGSAVSLLLAAKPLAQEILQEIVIKEAALRWIVRVAAVSAASVRDRLWKDIDEALDDLEVMVQLVERVDVAWPANQTLEFRDDLAHIT